ncbi:MAG: protein kinase domain-containing protein [Candidatus Acidiferrales bacterium]
MKKLGKYEIIGELGRGAMGIVYRARDPIINRLVALKTITTSVADDPNLLQRFYREAQSAGSLQHPNIVTIYDMGDEGGIPYIAMELVEGDNLEQVIAHRISLPISLKLVYAQQACRAFDFAHKRGIVHRDIKPGNVMVNKEGTVKVVDFGIARVLETSKTQTGMLIGTFAYMSPEQYHGEHADERSDIWSFGVLLYELLSYERPFSGATPASLMHSICQEEPRLLRELVPDCPSEFAEIVQRMLRKPPADRFQTMEDMLLDLDPVCKSLQSATVSELVIRSRQLVDQHDYSEARSLLRQALQVDSTNSQARNLLEIVNSELKRILIRPKAQQHVEKGHSLFKEGKIQEARIEAENALHLDSSFEPAQELQRLLQQELDRAQLVAEWLQSAKQHLAEGAPDAAEALLSKVMEIEPSNQQAKTLQQQVIKEIAERQRRLRLLDGLREARSLWTQQEYAECLQLLTRMGQEFPEEEEIGKLLDTVREDELEQRKLQGLEKARNLLAARRHNDCTVLLLELQKQFPHQDEIPKLLQAVHEDQEEQRKLQGLAEGRNLLAAGRYEESVALLGKLQKDFPDEEEISKLLKTVREDQAEQRRQKGVEEARNLRAVRRYEDCVRLLTELQTKFPGDDEIPELLGIVREDQAEQRRQQGVEKARNLRAARRYEDCARLLTELQAEFPKDDEIPGLLGIVREDQAEQRKLKRLAGARSLLASRRYEEAIAFLTGLQKEFPDEGEISKLVAIAREDQEHQRKLQSLAEARSLLAARKYENSIALLSTLQQEFPDEIEISRLLATAHEEQVEQQKQQKLTDVRALMAAQKFEEALAMLETLRVAHPKDTAILKLHVLVQDEQKKQAKFERLKSEREVLKKLVGDKQYAEVLSRAEKLLRDFPGDVDLQRLLEFARSQQGQIEQERQLRKTLEEVKGLRDASRFPDAIRTAQAGLKKFPDNPDLLHLLEQAEIQGKKLETRKLIEQRVRDIKIKINREKLSEAIELAKQTLVTMGPDTDVTQLLNSAQIEYQAREKKRAEEQRLETIRTLLDSGELNVAAVTLRDAVANKELDSFDPRVQRVSDEIEVAKTTATAASVPGPPAAPTTLAKEYAFLQGAPEATAPPPPSEASSNEAPAPQASATQPVVPILSVVSAPPPTVAVTPAVPTPQPAEIEASEPSTFLQELPIHRAEAHPRVATTALPTSAVAQRHPLTSAWKKPKVLASIGAALVVTAVFIYVIQPKTPLPPTNQPQQDQIGQRQQEVITRANSQIRAGDFQGAHDILQQAAQLQGPYSQEIQKMDALVQSGIKNKELRDLLQKEEQLWGLAMQQFQSNHFTEATATFQKVVNLPDGGQHKEEARKHINVDIPNRIREENLFDQVQKASGSNDPDSVRRAQALVEQVILLNGPRKQAAEDLRGEIQKKLNAFSAEKDRFELLQNQFNQFKQGDDDNSAQQLKGLQPQFQSMANNGGPLSKEARNYAESLIPAAIHDVQTRAANRVEDAAFQQAVERFREVSATNDKIGLEGVRKSFQPIVQTGGRHSSEARNYLTQIDQKLRMLDQPASPQAQPPPAKPTTPSVNPSNDDAAVRAIVQSYAGAFEQRNADALRRIWPSLGQRYSNYKNSFELASSIHMAVQVETVQISADGNSCTIVATVTQEYTPKGDKAKRSKDRAVFQLVKKDGSWVISSVQ